MGLSATSARKGPGHVGLVGQAMAKPRARTGRRPASTSGTGKRRGKVLLDQNLTGETPVMSARPEEGRQRRIRGGGARDLRGRNGRRRRFQGLWLNSFDGEQEGGEAELRGTSEEVGEAWNGSGNRRPD
jgi:hypothetical protein